MDRSNDDRTRGGGQDRGARPASTWRRLAGAVLALATFSLGLPASADDGSNAWILGGEARVDAPAPGGVTAMGGMVEVDAAVGGGVRAAGGTVRIAAPVARSVHAAGGRVEVRAPVGGDVRAAGGEVVLGADAVVDGRVNVAGGTVRLAGPVAGRVRIAAGTVFLDGRFDGDVEVNAGSLQIGPEAHIGGALRYAAGTPLQRHASARIDGPVEQREWSGRGWGHGGWTTWPGHRHERWHGGWRFGGWLWTGVLLLLAAVVASAGPRLTRASAATLGERPLASLFVGLALMLGWPMLAVLLFVTLIGIPFGLLVLALYPLLLLAGYVLAAVALGALVLERWRPGAVDDSGWRVAAALLAMTVLILAGRLPIVGGLVALLALLAGLGALWLQWRSTPRPPAGPPTAPAAA